MSRTNHRHCRRFSLILVIMLSAVGGGWVDAKESGAPNRSADDQWNFEVAERRLREIQIIGEQLLIISRETLPAGLETRDRSEAARFAQWLYNNSRKFQHLARGWDAFLRRVPRKAALAGAQLEQLQGMNRTFSLRYLTLISGATDEVVAFRFSNLALRERQERVVRLITLLQ